MNPTAYANAVLLGLNSKVFGHIPGIEVGATFDDRKALSDAGVHAPPLAGIHGDPVRGAFSIVMSDKYEDDKDHGEWL